MNTKKVNVQMLEPQPNNGIRTIDTMSAKLLPNPVLGEERSEKAEISDKQIEDFIVKLMEKNPVKFVQYALVVIGRDIFQSNATDFKFSQESDLEKGRRFKISVKGTIKEITNK